MQLRGEGGPRCREVVQGHKKLFAILRSLNSAGSSLFHQCWRFAGNKCSGSTRECPVQRRLECKAVEGIQRIKVESFFSGDVRLNRPVTHGVSLLKEIMLRELGHTKKHHSLFCPDRVESWLPLVSLL